MRTGNARRRAVYALYQRVHRRQIVAVRFGERALRFDRYELDEMMARSHRVRALRNSSSE